MALKRVLTYNSKIFLKINKINKKKFEIIH